MGIETIRNDVADYITRRDGGIVCDVDDVFISNGAAEAIHVKHTTVRRRTTHTTYCYLYIY